MSRPATGAASAHDVEPPPSVALILSLCERFAAATVPASEWTHRAHVIVATALVHRLGAAEALPAMRAGILRLNQAHGTEETPTRGYHETITRAFLALIAGVLVPLPPGTPVDACVAAVLASPLAARDVLLGYYSRERLFSLEARRGWLPPDLRPL